MEAATQPQASAKPPAHMLNEVGNFIRQYLVCSDQQAALLAVWVLHTWCYRAFPVTPYLNIQSPGPQSGKTLCLRLLQLLSPPGSWYISSPASTPFMKRLLALKPEQSSAKEPELDLPPAVFLDDREFTIGSSGHDSIVHFLSSGAHAASRYLHQVDHSPRLHEVSVFCPKAFAGIASLPPKLARHCLPVLLQRRKSTEKVQPLDRTAALYAKPLTAWMQQWSQENFERLAARAHLYSMELSTRYTPHDNQLCKPLLLIAQCIEGKWLENLGNALQRLLGDRDPNLTCEGLQLLVDLCRVFRENSNPPYIATRHLIPYLRGLDDRPWSTWGKAPEFSMARLLRPFGIASKSQRMNADSVIKVYRCEDFEETWSRYL